MNNNIIIKKQYLKVFVENLMNLIYDKMNGVAVINNNITHYMQSPRKLYRYCRFDENGYTLDSIENEYVYLSPANILDDDFECAVDENELLSNYVDKLIDNEYYFNYFVEELLKEYNIYTPFIHSVYKKDITDNKYDYYYWFKYLIEDAGLDINDATTIASMISFYIDNKERIAIEAKEMCAWLKNSREKTGICSFTTVSDSQVMWDMYADNYKGIMIEYDFNLYDESNLIDIFPVIYQNSRETDPIKITLNILMNSYGKTKRVYEKERFYALYNQISTKNEEWSFQDEWRIAGNANVKSKTPRISAIYLGSKVSNENKNKIIELSSKLLYKVYIQSFDSRNTKIVYKEITNIDSIYLDKKKYLENVGNQLIELKYDEIESYHYSKLYYNYTCELFKDEYNVSLNCIINGYNYNYVVKNKKNKKDILVETKYWKLLPNNDEIEVIMKNIDLKKMNYVNNTKRECDKFILLVFANEYLLSDIQYLYEIFDSNIDVEYINSESMMPINPIAIDEEIKELYRESKPKG